MIYIQQVTDIERLLKMRMEVLKCVFSLPDDYDLAPLREANRKFYQESLDNGTHLSLEAFYIPDNNSEDKDVKASADTGATATSELESEVKSYCKSDLEAIVESEADRNSIAFALSEDVDSVDPDSFMDDSDYMWEMELEEISTPKDEQQKDNPTKGYLCGSADLCFYKEMPSPDNPTGECAYIMNVYVRTQFRTRGIATSLVKELIKKARERGAGKVYLESTKMARPLYQSLGFCDMEDMMHLPIQ